MEYFWRTCVSKAGPPKPRPLGRPASADTTADWAPTQARERGPGTGCGLRGASAPRGRRGLNGLKAGCMSRDSLRGLGTLLLIIIYSFSFLCERGKERKKGEEAIRLRSKGGDGGLIGQQVNGPGIGG